MTVTQAISEERKGKGKETSPISPSEKQKMKREISENEKS